MRKEARVISPALEYEFICFIENHSAKRFNRNLRRMLLEHLMSKGGMESPYMQYLLFDLEGLFELLEVVEEWQ